MRNFDIVKDSSIWHNNNNFSAVERKDPYLRIGIVKKVYIDKLTTDLRYLVEMRDRNDAIELNCRLLRKFGGVFNYEEVIFHGYKFDDKPDPVQAFDAKAGDVVLVGLLNGEAREGIILGSLSHPARKSKMDIAKGQQYMSEFNGIETSINELGEYKLTFKAIPKNIKKLDEKPSQKLPAPEYDDKIGTSFFKFDKTGSYEVSDNSKEEGFQNLKIDKAKGTFEINSGKIKLLLTKKGEKISIKCKDTTLTSDDKITAKTKEFSLDASKSAKIKSAKVAIGKDGVELLAQIFQLVEKLGMVKPISPVGPCTPLMATPEWPDVKQIQSKIKEITGTL